MKDVQMRFPVIQRTLSRIIAGVKLRRLTAPVAKAVLVFAMASAQAGMPIFSSNSIPGYFLGTGLDPNTSQHLDEIKNVCDKHGPIWALGEKAPFKCVGAGYEPDDGAGSGMSFGVTIEPVKGVTYGYDGSYGWTETIFSTHPFPAYEWKSRHATDAEVKAIIALFKNNKNVFKGVKAAIASGNVSVMDTPKRTGTVFLILWKPPGPPPGDEGQGDMEAENPHYVVVIREHDRYFETGNYMGDVSVVGDLDGDDFPELKVSTSCDGHCVEVVSSKTGEVLMSAMGH